MPASHRLRALITPMSRLAVVVLCLSSLQGATAAQVIQPAPWVVTVVDDSTGEPIAGAELRLRVNDGQNLLNTDQTGRAMVESAVGARFVSVTASAPQFVPMRVFWNTSSTPLGVPAEGFTIRLPRGVVVGGMVQDEQGRGVPNALIYFSCEPVEFDPQRGSPAGIPQASIYDLPLTTDAQGRWTCDIMPSQWRGARIRTELANFYNAPFGERLADPNALRERTAVLKLSKGVRIAGTIRDAQGMRISGATISYDVDGGSRVPNTVSNENGEYLFPHARRGDDLALLIRADGYAPQFRRVPQDRPDASIDITLEPAKEIQGKVVDSGGKPISDARIIVTEYDGMRMLVGWDARSDVDGTFKLDGSDKRIEVDVLAGGGVTSGRDIVLRAGSENVIRLQRRVLITGTVVDAQTGLTIPSGRIMHSYHDPESPIWQPHQPTIFQLGIFQMTLSEPGPGYLLKFEAEGYRPLVSRLFKSDEGEVVYEARMVPGSGPRGIVRTPDGRPAVGASIIAALKGTQVMLENDRFTSQTSVPIVVSDAQGGYQLAAQPEDDFFIIATHESGYLNATFKEISAAGGDDLKLLAWATVQGVVKIGDKPAAGARVGGYVVDPFEQSAGPRMQITLSAIADEQGRFQLRAPPGRDVSIGRYIQVGDPSSTHTHSVRLTTKPGETVTIAIGGTGRPVVGKIQISKEMEETGWSSSLSSLRSQSDPTALPGFAKSQAMTPAQRQEWLKTEEGIAYLAASRKFEASRKYYPVDVKRDGSFRIEDVEAGTYDLQIRIAASPPGQLYAPNGPQRTARLKVIVPPMDTGRSDEAMDIGVVGLSEIPGRP